MTNEEAIEVLNKINPFNDNSKMQEYFESVEIAINSIQENTKLKAEIEKLKEYIENQKKLYEFKTDLQLKYKYKNIDEIAQLIAEVERYKKLIHKMCETCEYEDLLGYEYPCENCTHYSNWKLKCEVFDD